MTSRQQQSCKHLSKGDIWGREEGGKRERERTTPTMVQRSKLFFGHVLDFLPGTRTLLGTPGIATRNKKLLGAKGIATRSKDAIRA